MINNEIQTVIEKFKEVRNLLKNFDNKEEAIEFLINETKLSKEDCSTAYERYYYKNRRLNLVTSYI